MRARHDRPGGHSHAPKDRFVARDGAAALWFQAAAAARRFWRRGVLVGSNGALFLVVTRPSCATGKSTVALFGESVEFGRLVIGPDADAHFTLPDTGGNLVSTLFPGVGKDLRVSRKLPDTIYRAYGLLLATSYATTLGGMAATLGMRPFVTDHDLPPSVAAALHSHEDPWTIDAPLHHGVFLDQLDLKALLFGAESRNKAMGWLAQRHTLQQITASAIAHVFDDPLGARAVAALNHDMRKLVATYALLDPTHLSAVASAFGIDATDPIYQGDRVRLYVDVGIAVAKEYGSS